MKWFKRKPKFRHIAMGEGKILTAHGTFDNKPCIVFCESPVQGIVGEDAPEFMDYVRNHGVIITMADPAAAMKILDMIQESMQKFIKEMMNSDE